MIWSKWQSMFFFACVPLNFVCVLFIRTSQINKIKASMVYNLRSNHYLEIAVCPILLPVLSIPIGNGGSLVTTLSYHDLVVCAVVVRILRTNESDHFKCRYIIQSNRHLYMPELPYRYRLIKETQPTKNRRQSINCQLTPNRIAYCQGLSISIQVSLTQNLMICIFDWICR